jgi:hypothetical protein
MAIITLTEEDYAANDFVADHGRWHASLVRMRMRAGDRVDYAAMHNLALAAQARRDIAYYQDDYDGGDVEPNRFW